MTSIPNPQPAAADTVRRAALLRAFLLIIAVIEAAAAPGNIALLLANDPEVPGPGWGGWAVTAHLALAPVAALLAIYFAVVGQFARAIIAIAATVLLQWLSYLPSFVNHPDDFSGGIAGAHAIAQMFVFPLLAVPAVALAWTGKRIVLAAILACIPAIANMLGIVAFGIGVMIYGF